MIGSRPSCVGRRSWSSSSPSSSSRSASWAAPCSRSCGRRPRAGRPRASPPIHRCTASPARRNDDTVREQTVFATEAGLSFFHTHAEGTGLVLFFAATLVASVVRPRALRGVLYALLTVGALFPLGYLVYAFAVLQLGRETGIEIAETWVLTPLGASAIVGLIGLAVVLARREPAAAPGGR